LHRVPGGGGDWQRIQKLLTHTAWELGEIILGRLVLLVLVEPLVEVGLEEVHLFGVLEEARPVGLAELFLLQLHLDVLRRVVRLALSRVDLGVELELQVVRLLERVRVAGEGQALGLEVKLQIALGDVRDRDGEVDEVLARIGQA
jgi:hypothetical protein